MQPKAESGKAMGTPDSGFASIRATALVTESGIHAHADVARMRRDGIHAFLVGEAFMTAPDPGARLAELFGLDAASGGTAVGGAGTRIGSSPGSEGSPGPGDA